MPGKFVNKKTGEDIDVIINDKRFNSTDCTVREWYETLVETVIDVCNNIHRIDKIGANNVHVGSTAAAILESTVLFKPTLLSYKAESDVTKIGSIVNLALRSRIIAIIVDLNNIC